MFTVYISSNNDVDSFDNCYGYFTGKCYTNNGGIFPVTDKGITDRNKQYTSNGRAVRGAEALLNKCVYVLAYKVKEN